MSKPEATPAPATTIDAFIAFNRAQGQGSLRDPYPALAALRRAGPVHRLATPGRRVGSSPVVFNVVSYEAVSEVLRDASRFDSSRYAQVMGPVMGRTILQMDGPEHTRHRSLLQSAFSKKAMRRWEPEQVRPAVHRCIDAFAARGEAELVRELTFPFPVRVIAGMLGLDEADHDEFHRRAVQLISYPFAPAPALEASRALGEMFARVLARRRSRPRGDLISLLAQAEVDGARLEDEEILSFCRLLAPAGAETTYRSSSNLLLALLTHRTQLDAVRRDRTLALRAIDEALRWECPLLSIIRTATRDTTLCGMPIPAGSVLVANLGAANRDETRYEDPDTFDVFRTQRPHLAFAFGAHRCLGQHLALMETRVVLDAVLERLPGLRLNPEAGDVRITGLMFRSPLALPVRFEPS